MKIISSKGRFRCVLLQVSDGQRVLISDEGDIGITVVYQERSDENRDFKKASWTRVGQEEVLIPRDVWPEVIKIITQMLETKVPPAKRTRKKA